MSRPTIRSTTLADQTSAVDTVVLAFATDPVARWCWPAPRAYLANMPGFTRAFAGGAFQYEAGCCSDDYAGAALWLPPGVGSDQNAVGEIIEGSVADDVQSDMFAVFEQMASYHPHEPHWYLPLIGVDPLRQSQGYGAALMSYACERCDRERLPAYLESTNPRNVSLYKRHGFEALATIQVGSSPPIVPMLRRPR